MTQDEVLVDCGAFDGDTVLEFLACTQGRFKHVFSYEPDPTNFDKLEG